MRAPIHNTELRRLWSSWVDVVSEVAERARRTNHMSTIEYTQLHASLLRSIEDTLSQTPRDEARRIVLQMQKECRPWISLEAFAITEKRVLLKVADRSRQLQQQLDGRHILNWRSLSCILIVVGLVAGCIAVYRYLTPSYAGTSFSYEVRGIAYRMWFAMQRIEPLTWVAVIVTLVVVLGVWMMRTTKQY